MDIQNSTRPPAEYIPPTPKQSPAVQPAGEGKYRMGEPYKYCSDNCLNLYGFGDGLILLSPSEESLKAHARTIIDALNSKDSALRHEIPKWSFSIDAPTKDDPFASIPLEVQDIGYADRLIRFHQHPSNETLLKRIEELEGRLKIGENLFVDLGTEYGMEKAYRQDLQAQLAEANKAVEWIRKNGRHQRNCPQFTNDDLFREPYLAPCNCGLGAILAAKTKG